MEFHVLNVRCRFEILKCAVDDSYGKEMAVDLDGKINATSLIDCCNTLLEEPRSIEMRGES